MTILNIGWIVLLYLVRVTRACHCSSLPAVETQNKGMTLRGHSYLQLQVSRILFCGTRCLRQSRCRSVNYNPQTQICELNSETHVTAPADFDVAADPLDQYYTADQWDKGLLGRCQQHQCPPEKVCEPVFGTPDTYKCLDTYRGDKVVVGTSESPPTCSFSTSCADCTLNRVVDGMTFEAVGCIRSTGPKVLPDLVLNMRGGNVYDWAIPTTFQSVINECAEVTKSYNYFGVEYYGECWAGMTMNTGAGFSDVPVTECDTKCLYTGDPSLGVGSADVMFVYRWI